MIGSYGSHNGSQHGEFDATMVFPDVGSQQRNGSNTTPWISVLYWEKGEQLGDRFMGIDREISVDGGCEAHSEKFWQFWADNFGQKSQFWEKVKILSKNLRFRKKSKFWAKFKILGKIQNFGQNSKFWAKLKMLVINQNFG